jgi:hypothetical protein
MAGKGSVCAKLRGQGWAAYQADCRGQGWADCSSFWMEWTIGKKGSREMLGVKGLQAILQRCFSFAVVIYSFCKYL